MAPYHIKREQFFTSDSINALQSLINKNTLIFVCNNIHMGLNKSPYMGSTDALIGVRKWEKIIAHDAKETTEALIQISSYIDPIENGQKEIVVTSNNRKRIANFQEDYNETSMITVFGRLKQIEIYHHIAEYEEYDIQTLKGHVFKQYYPKAPKNFSHLITEYNYFVFLVFHFENRKMLIIEKTESPDFFNFFMDNATEKLASIKSAWNDETNDLYYHLVHTVK